MTDAEIQLVGYVEGILRTRGYGDLADGLNTVAQRQSERRARLLAPPCLAGRGAPG